MGLFQTLGTGIGAATGMIPGVLTASALVGKYADDVPAVGKYAVPLVIGGGYVGATVPGVIGNTVGWAIDNAIAHPQQEEQINASQAQKILEDYYLKQRQGIVR